MGEDLREEKREDLRGGKGLKISGGGKGLRGEGGKGSQQGKRGKHLREEKGEDLGGKRP